jgi:hypothetical protein
MYITKTPYVSVGTSEHSCSPADNLEEAATRLCCLNQHEQQQYLTQGTKCTILRATMRRDLTKFYHIIQNKLTYKENMHMSISACTLYAFSAPFSYSGAAGSVFVGSVWICLCVPVPVSCPGTVVQRLQVGIAAHY